MLRYTLHIYLSDKEKTRRRLQVDATTPLGALQSTLISLRDQKVHNVFGVKIIGEPYPVGAKQLQRFLHERIKPKKKQLLQKLLTIRSTPKM